MLKIFGKRSFNREHPELKEGEVFLTNINAHDFHCVGWKTKRGGKVAYDVHGEVVATDGSFFPVFAQKAELETNGIDTESLNQNRFRRKR